MTSDFPPSLDWPGLAVTQLIVRAVTGEAIALRSIRLLCDALHGLKQHSAMYFRSNSLSTATERIRWAKSVRRALKKAINANSRISAKTFEWPSKTFLEFMTHRVSGHVQPATKRELQQQKIRMMRMLEDEPAKLLMQVETLIEDALGEKQLRRRKPDRGLDLIFEGLLDAYELTFQRRATVSTNAGQPSGPLMRFLLACLKLLDIRPQSPEGIRDRVRKLNKTRISRLPN